MGSVNKEIINWFEYSVLVKKSDSELNEKTKELKKWANKRLKSDNHGFPDVLFEITRNFMENFLHYLKKASSELDMKLDVNSFNGFILSVRMRLSKLQKLFVVLEHLYERENIHIHHHSVGVQLMTSYLGHKYYPQLYDIINCELRKTIVTVEKTDSRLNTLCQYFSDIGFGANYQNLIEASWILKDNPPPSRFILDILKNLAVSFDISISKVEYPVCLEERLNLYMEHLNSLTLSIYPEECFAICRTAYLKTFASLTFYKSLVLESLCTVKGVALNGQKSERIIQEKPFTSSQLYNANLEITTRWLHKLMKQKKDHHNLILRMIFLMSQEKNLRCSIINQYKFVLRPADVPRFMKLLVRHLLLFEPEIEQSHISRQDPSNIMNNKLHEKNWLDLVANFLQNYQLMQPFVNAFFEQYVLKSLVKETLTLESIKSSLTNNSSSTLQLQRFFTILKHNKSVWNKTQKLIVNAATTVRQTSSDIGVNCCISLPKYLFPNISLNECTKLPFSIPEKWLVPPLSVVPLSDVAVKFQNQPHLQRVLMKPWNLGETEVVLDLNLFHAIILDTFFNKSCQWLLTDMIKILDVKDVSVFRYYLSSLVSCGLLIQKGDDYYSLNRKFEPNTKLLKRGTIVILP